jgi:hypothetical protein
MTSLLLVVNKNLAKNVRALVAAHTLRGFCQTPRVRHVASRHEENMVAGGALGIVRGGRHGVESTTLWHDACRPVGGGGGAGSVHRGGALGASKRRHGEGGSMRQRRNRVAAVLVLKWGRKRARV